MSERIRTTRRLARQFASIVVVITAGTSAVALVDSGADVGAAASPLLDGTTSADAGASCWEIKLLHPASGDGIYWLRTETLQRPEQFYCDMTTDEGGWVLIGRGREGWTFRDYGQLTVRDVRDTVIGPGAFSPAALSTELIDGLLDGGNVKDLPDGLRLSRATNSAGTNFQEMRWKFQDLTSWSWAVGGGHRLGAWSIDGAPGTGSNSKDSAIEMPGETGAGNRSATGFDGWFTFPWAAHDKVAGFSFRGAVAGQNNATSYLWERATEKNAIPFTQLYIRPRLRTPILSAIPNAGVGASTLAPLLDD